MVHSLQSLPIHSGTRKCDLCLTENLAIMKADPESLLNTRDEFVSKCSINLIYIYIYIYLYNSAPVALSTHSGDISCSLLISPSHTDESSERRWTLLVYFRNRHLKIFLHVSPGCPVLITDQIYGKTASLIVFRHVFYHNLDYGAYFQFSNHDLFEKVDWN